MPTKIAWARNPDGSPGETWNPVTGCTPVSEGCAHCYAKRITKRFGGDFSKVMVHPDRLEVPLKRQKPTTYFVCSMGDLFHEDVPDLFVHQVFGVMGRSRQHTFQVLTKRPERMREWIRRQGAWLESIANTFGRPATASVMPHIWLGVSVENQARADERIPILLETPAAVRFVSCEPLLGPLDLRIIERDGEGHQHEHYMDALTGFVTCTDAGWAGKISQGGYPRLDWVIVGGESGGPPERRLVERCWHDDGGFLGEEHHGLQHLGPERVKGSYHWCPKPEALGWVRKIRDDCQAAGVALWFKQWGPRAGQGTLVDGREHKEMPRQEVRA